MTRTSLRAVARRHGLKTIILFGSRARGDAGPGSDCDLCVSAPGFRGDELRLIGDLCKALREDVDLCLFERIGPSLKFTVATEGRLLYGKRDTFDRLRLHGIKEWQDSRKTLDAVRAYLSRRES